MEYIDIGGRRLATWCSGTGDPLVILETGLGAPSGDWVEVQQQVESVTRVCRYDRGNCGESDAVGTPRSARDMSDDLHALTKELSPTTPVVLVGHSFGGLVCLDHAHRWRDRVAALVLVDPTHPDQFTTLGPMMPDAFGPMKEFWQTGWRSTESTAERIDFDKSFEQVRAIQDLGDLRTVVLTSDTWQGLDDNAVAQQTWIRFHDDYVALSSNAEQRVVPDSDHFIQRSAPSVVAEAIKEVVGQLQ